MTCLGRTIGFAFIVFLKDRIYFVLFGYSEASARRRIEAMRLMQELPEVERSVEEGRVSLSNVSLLQTFLRKEKKESRQTCSQATKLELLEEVSGVSPRECERRLAEISPVVLISRDRERVVNPTQTEIRFTAGNELLEKLERVKGLIARRVPASSYAELFEAMADLVIQRLDPAAKKLSKPAAAPSPEVASSPLPLLSPPPLSSPPPAPEVVGSGNREDSAPVPQKKGRHVPAAIRRELWRRDQGRCSYVDSRTVRRRGSRYALQIEHLRPFALGGMHNLENLTLRCRTHDILSAIAVLRAREDGTIRQDLIDSNWVEIIYLSAPASGNGSGSSVPVPPS